MSIYWEPRWWCSMSVCACPNVDAFVVGGSGVSGLLLPPTPRKAWESYPILLAWGSRIAVTMWKNLPPQAFATGLPESTMCFLPCGNTAERALLTRMKKCFSRFLPEFDLHAGPLGGCHGISAAWCPDLSWSLPARGVSWELSVHHSYVPLF